MKIFFSGKKNYDTILGRENLENFSINELNENYKYRDQPWHHQELLKNITLGSAPYHPVTAKQSNMLCKVKELMVTDSIYNFRINTDNINIYEMISDN